MTQKIDERVLVTLASDKPKRVVWKNREYIIEKIGLRHTFKKGSTLYHVFSVSTSSLFMRLLLNTENLQWRLTEVSDEL